MLYCRESTGNTSDFFLIIDIYGNKTLCSSTRKKIEKLKDKADPELSQNQIITFEYLNNRYKYNEKNNTITPIYFNLSDIPNKTILNGYSEGICSKDEVKSKKALYGINRFSVKTNNFYVFLLYVEIPTLILVIVSALIWLSFKLYLLGFFECLVTITIVIIKVIYKRKKFNNQLKLILNSEEDIDDAYLTKKVRIIRKYMVNTSVMKYCYKEQVKIYPGDVLIIKQEDTIPCDCLILEGECIISESKLNGKTSFIRKINIDNSIVGFSYKENYDSIVLKGSKVLKCHSKKEDRSIVALCINTGSNTYEANLFSSITYQNKLEFSLLYQNRITHFILNIAIFILSTIILFIIDNFKKDITQPITDFILKSLATSLTPTYYLILSLVYIFSNNNLNAEHIQCVDNSRLYCSARVTTVVFDKTGTLSQNQLEIAFYHPLYRNHKEYKLSTIIPSNISHLRREHLKHYKDKYDNCCPNEKYEISILYLECLVTCNNLEIVSGEVCGNLLEMTILNQMKWDMNSIDITVPNRIEEISTFEIYPKNYYKISEKRNFREDIHSINFLKLRILKRFFHDSSMNVSALVYNTFNKTIRFNIKGPPEVVLPICNPSSFPSNIKQFLAVHRIEGYRVIACATKIIPIDSFSYEKDEDYYKNNLTFVGFISFVNRLNPEVKEVVQKLKDMKCEMVICTGDWVYTSIAVAYNADIITDKNIYVFDLDDNKEIVINHLYKAKLLSLLTTSDQKPIEENEYKNEDRGAIRKKRTKSNEGWIKSTNNPSLSMSSERKQMLEYTMNSIQRMNKDTTILQVSDVNERSMSRDLIKYKKPNTTILKYSLKLLSKIKHNAIFCISGKAFNEIYSHKEEYKKLLHDIQKKCKIFYSFSSSDKETLIQYLKTLPSKIVCMVGDGPNDIPAMLSSHVGIKIRLSNSALNNCLCHFYSLDENLYCIEKIIKNGRACYENSILLFSFIIISSSLESFINIYSFYMSTNLPSFDRLILDLIIFITSSFAFRMKADKDIDNNIIFQSGLFLPFIKFKIFFIFLSKVGFQLGYLYWYEYNPQLPLKEARTILLSYLFILLVFQLLSTLFSFNTETYFRKSYNDNFCFNFMMVLIVCFFISLLSISSRFIDLFLLNIMVFENNDFELDHYDDKNKLMLVVFMFSDYCCTIFIIFVLKRIFIWISHRNIKVGKFKDKIILSH